MQNWIEAQDGAATHLSHPFRTEAWNIPQIEVIAHSLSQINRFTGHAARPMSVAEHSLLVEEIARTFGEKDPDFLLYCLMHDAHECVFGDISSPLKQELGESARLIESDLETAMLQKYNLWSAEHIGLRGLKKHCDLIALATEKRDLLPRSIHEWSILQNIPPHKRSLKTLFRTYAPWQYWRWAFLRRFRQLDQLRITRAAA